MRFSSMARCASAGGCSLSGRLAALAQRVEEHIASRGTAAAAHDDGLWEQVLSTAHCARALKETDTALAVVFRLLRCGCRPSLKAVWPGLIRDLAPYSDIEANAVLAYPGVPEGPCSRRGVGPVPHAGGPEEAPALGSETEMADMPPLLRPTRETLLMTGGVVPLSARVPCSDGGALSVLIEAFCGACDAAEGGANEPTAAYLQEVAAAVVSALQPISATMLLTESSPLARALVRFFRLLLQFSTRQPGEQPRLAEHFAKGLTKLLPDNALGARIVLLFLAERHAEFGEEMVQLPLVRLAARAVRRHYEKHENFSCLRQLQDVSEAVDVTLQRNANSGNPLAVDAADEAALRLLLSLALLRAMRVEAASPDVFLGDAVDIVDRAPMTLSIEYELIVAKVQLLGLFLDDASSSGAIYDDLLQSLRAIVELRPREGVDGDTAAATDATQQVSGEAAGEAEEEEERKALERQQFQEAHRLVLTAFARSQLEERLNQAYTILVTHKYHGLVITKDAVNPLLDALSRRGDCRVFNIVDLCVLYSGSHIDYDTLIYLFRACRVARDFYRARTLYQLLREMIPGFLLRAPEAIKDALQELKILPPEPAHLFPASLAVDGDEAAAAVTYEGVLADEALTACQRGPIRELPTTHTHTLS
ncbi:uncharacterized protein Tco025E_00976 [Trypanosoma conorhini]|uniref:Uncharacterized protein n=1 Tax=Trypanosoma conorhini TaxID=83891 RepID=A0A3R7PXI4_9TRYP|nr:uncharacterized protein Tco025E_00976 [Trypanosoma conorhini]RNF26742.1 hypothetical protein Tco025E_00976 [Trypanosoma conorhini]